MTKLILKFSWAFVLFGTFLFTACEKLDENLITENAVIEGSVDEIMVRMQEENKLGPRGCFELVFPVTVIFPDGATATAIDHEELRSTIKAWKEANPDATDRPTLEFPIEVINEDGEVISVADADEFKALKEECRANDPRGPRGPKGGKGKPCFDLVFPITIVYPDGTTADAASKEELKDLIRTWKADNPDATDRPELQFPLDVTMEDGTVVTVNDVDELKALKKSCRDNN